MAPVSENAAARATVPSAATVTVVGALDGWLSLAFTVVEPPSSAISSSSSSGVTVGAGSSSLTVSVAPSGWSTPWVFSARAATVTSRSGASVSLSTAVSVTDPVLSRSPAGTVRRPPPLAVNASDAVSVSVVGSLDGCDSVAVTVVSCWFPGRPVSSDSRIDGSSRTSAGFGAGSSSAIIRAWSCGSTMPSAFDAVAETVNVLSGASVSLSAAVSVTVPVLDVRPAGIVSVTLADSARSAATAGATAAADTTISVSAPDARSSVAVTVLTCRLPGVPVSSDSRIEAGVSASVATGSGSSLRMVPFALVASTSSVTFTGADRVTVKVSSASSAASSTVSTATLADRVPAAKVSWPESAVKSAAAAVSPAPIEVAQSTVSARPLGASSVTVKAIALPSSPAAAAMPASGGSSSSAIATVRVEPNPAPPTVPEISIVSASSSSASSTPVSVAVTVAAPAARVRLRAIL